MEEKIKNRNPSLNLGWEAAFLGGLGVLVEVLFGLSAAVYSLIGFSFGIDELGAYVTWLNGLTNLFYHALPGLGSAGLSLGIFLVGALLLWCDRKMMA